MVLRNIIKNKCELFQHGVFVMWSERELSVIVWHCVLRPQFIYIRTNSHFALHFSTDHTSLTQALSNTLSLAYTLFTHLSLSMLGTNDKNQSIVSWPTRYRDLVNIYLLVISFAVVVLVISVRLVVLLNVCNFVIFIRG